MVDNESAAAMESSAAVREYPRWLDVVGVAWVLVAACVALVPTLVHGSYFGSFDLLARYGLTARPGVIVHNGAVGDQTDEVVPWITMAWTQVHHGHLPLWNTYEVNGMPLAFNWGSGAFSLPALVSYLTPLRIIYWVQIAVSFVVGGTGAYFFGRVLRLHPIACTFAATTWVLSGPFFGYLGLPDTSVMSWAGWQFAAVVLLLYGRHRYLAVVLLAVSLAFSILAGNPQIEILIVLALVVFVAVVLICRMAEFHDSGPIRRPVVDLAVATVAGVALAGPLVLPGLQLAAISVRNVSPYAVPDPKSQVLGLVFQSFWGQPLAGSYLNGQGFFPTQWAYVGAIAVVLAVVAVAIRWRRPVVLGLAAAAIVAIGASVLLPVEQVLNALPLVGHSWWSRSLIPLAFLVAMLGAIGLDVVIRQEERRRTAWWAFSGFSALAVVIGLLWLFGRGSLPGYAAHVRAWSFVWPSILTGVGLLVFGWLVLHYRRADGAAGDPMRWRRLAIGVGGSLLVLQTVYLVVADGPVFGSSSTPFQPTPAVAALQRAVGPSLVGLGVGRNGGLGLGLAPDSNVDYGIREFAEYDPIAPQSFFSDWVRYNGTPTGVEEVYDFAPSITRAAVARRYGVSYVLEQSGHPGPSGAVFDTRVGNEDLYRIPGAATATLVPTIGPSAWPSVDASGTAVPVETPSPSQVRIVTDSTSPEILRLRLTALPGWSATIDGRPLATATYLSWMLQARLPPGRHVIELTYWPKRFTEGIVLAIVAVIGLGSAGLVTRRRLVASRDDPVPDAPSAGSSIPAAAPR
ncbi:MAG: YfhO family protein [Acidimicrobiales bacterium]